MYRAALLLILTATLTAQSWAQLNKLELTVMKVEPTESGHGPEGSKTVTLHVQNNSNKTVVAVDIEMTLKDAGGNTYKTDVIHDYGYPSYDKKMPATNLAAPSKGIDISQLINPDETLVSARLMAVVYADRTAQGDNDAIDGMVSSRKHAAEVMAKQHPENPDYGARVAKYAQDDLRRQP